MRVSNFGSLVDPVIQELFTVPEVVALGQAALSRAPWYSLALCTPRTI